MLIDHPAQTLLFDEGWCNSSCLCLVVDDGVVCLIVSSVFVAVNKPFQFRPCMLTSPTRPTRFTRTPPSRTLQPRLLLLLGQQKFLFDVVFTESTVFSSFNDATNNAALINITTSSPLPSTAHPNLPHRRETSRIRKSLAITRSFSRFSRANGESRVKVALSC
jgi:hypothetical protein